MRAAGPPALACLVRLSACRRPLRGGGQGGLLVRPSALPFPFPPAPWAFPCRCPAPSPARRSRGRERLRSRAFHPWSEVGPTRGRTDGRPSHRGRRRSRATTNERERRFPHLPRLPALRPQGACRARRRRGRWRRPSPSCRGDGEDGDRLDTGGTCEEPLERSCEAGEVERVQRLAAASSLAGILEGAGQRPRRGRSRSRRPTGSVRGGPLPRCRSPATPGAGSPRAAARECCRARQVRPMLVRRALWRRHRLLEEAGVLEALEPAAADRAQPREADVLSDPRSQAEPTCGRVPPPRLRHAFR